MDTFSTTAAAAVAINCCYY